MPVQAVTDATFEQAVLRSELPVLIDLYADWCEPCKQLAPIMEQLAGELEGKLQVVKIDVEHNPMVAQSFKVQSIPMVVLIHQGKVAGHHVGLLDKQQLLQMVEPVLPTDASEVKPDQLAQLIAAKRAVPIDVRDAATFARYHIPTARNVPAQDVVKRAQELAPTDGRVRVLYARSTEEARSLAERLLATGVQVGYLSGGFLHWEADGLEVERG